MTDFEFNPNDIEIPDFLSPILAYLCAYLPPPLDSLLLYAVAYSLAALSTLVSVIMTLTNGGWDPQSILPPIVTLLLAYLALRSFYRTTTWMMRTTFWFAKWGTILAVLAASAGYFMGNTGLQGFADGGLLKRGLLTGLGGLLLDMMNGKNDDSPRSKSKTQTGNSRTRTKGRPKVWDSFQAQRDWQYQENGRDRDNNAQKVISDIVDGAQRVLKESGWWEAAKGMLDNVSGGSDPSGSSRKEKSKRQTKKTGRGTR